MYESPEDFAPVETPAKYEPVATPEQNNLQTIFSDAYMRERERFNSIYGTLDNNPPFQYTDYMEKTVAPVVPVEEDVDDVQAEQIAAEDTVPLKKYKKAKGWAVFFLITTAIAVGAVVYFIVDKLL